MTAEREGNDRLKLKLTTSVHVTDDAGHVHSFTPDDDVPRWARDKIGLHAWGYQPPRRRGRTFDVVSENMYADGKPSFIDVLCTHPPGRESAPIARFEAAVLLSAHGIPAWEWWWTAKLNGPAGAFAKKSTVKWGSATGPQAGSIGALHPADDEPIEIGCPICPARLNRHWVIVRHMLDLARHAGHQQVELLELVKTGRYTIRGK